VSGEPTSGTSSAHPVSRCQPPIVLRSLGHPSSSPNGAMAMSATVLAVTSHPRSNTSRSWKPRSGPHIACSAPGSRGAAVARSRLTAPPRPPNCTRPAGAYSAIAPPREAGPAARIAASRDSRVTLPGSALARQAGSRDSSSPEPITSSSGSAKTSAIQRWSFNSRGLDMRGFRD